MTDAENSDDERYANESFENESDAEVSELESESAESSNDSDDHDDKTFHSNKINTGPIRRKIFPGAINQTDAVPFDSSSEEEDVVIVGQTVAEINTLSMMFDDVLGTSAPHQINVNEEKKESFEEIVSEEEIDIEEEEKEFRKIKDLEEKYLQRISAQTNLINVTQTEHLEEEVDETTEENPIEEELSKSENKAETEEAQEYAYKDETPLVLQGNKSQEGIPDKKSFNSTLRSSESQVIVKANTLESRDQTKLETLIQSSLVSFDIDSPNYNEDYLLEFCQASVLNEIRTQTHDTTKLIDSEKIALAVMNALKSANFKISQEKDAPNISENNQKPLAEFKEADTDDKQLRSEPNNNNCSTNEQNENESLQYKNCFPYTDIENSNNYNEDEEYIYYDARITSKTPTSFNSDEYIFHANFINPFYSTDKLRPKPQPRKSMSFSNERMREIERHNQILLRKILAKKPTYSLKNKSSQFPLEKIHSQTNMRLTASAINRKNQQRQIYLDNQVLKRKIKAIALRRSPYVT